MTEYLRKFLSDFHETIQGRVTTPAADHLFTVRYNTYRKLPEKEQSAAFNHAVAQLILSNPWVRKDIQTAVSFLTKISRIPNGCDW